MLQQDKAQHNGKKNEVPFINLVFIRTDVLGYTEKSYCFFLKKNWQSKGTEYIDTVTQASNINYIVQMQQGFTFSKLLN